MASTTKVLGDGERLNALLDSHLLQRSRLPGLDRITQLACRVLNVETCCISAVDQSMQCFKNHHGRDMTWARDVPAHETICQHVIARGGNLAITDTAQHVLTRYNSALQLREIRSYLGAPLLNAGHAIGTICVVDRQARHWTETETTTLEGLARCAMLELSLAKSGTSLFDLAGCNQPGVGPIA